MCATLWLSRPPNSFSSSILGTVWNKFFVRLWINLWLLCGFLIFFLRSVQQGIKYWALVRPFVWGVCLPPLLAKLPSLETRGPGWEMTNYKWYSSLSVISSSHGWQPLWPVTVTTNKESHGANGLHAFDVKRSKFEEARSQGGFLGDYTHCGRCADRSWSSASVISCLR